MSGVQNPNTPDVNTPPAFGGGFSDKLCGNPLAWRPKARSMPIGPEMHDTSRSNVPVENASAFAAVHPLGKRLGLNYPAFRAGLRCAARVDFDDLTTSFCSFVIEHRNQLRPCGVVNFLGEHPARQAFDVEILYGNSGEASDNARRQLVQHVAAPSGDNRDVYRQAIPSLRPALGVSLTSSERALPLPQSLGAALRPIWTFHHLPVGKRDKRGKSCVYPNSFTFALSGGFHVNVEYDKPFAVLPAEDRALRIGWQVPVPFNLYLAGNADKPDAPRLSQGEAVADAILRRVIARAGAETREPRLVAALNAREKRRERLVEPAKNLLFSTEGPARQAIVRCARGLQFKRLLSIGQSDALSLPRFDALLQSRVIERAKVSKHVRKGRRLNAVRVDAMFVGQYQIAGLVSGDTDRGQERVVGCQPFGAFAVSSTPNHHQQERVLSSADLRRRASRPDMEKVKP